MCLTCIQATNRSGSSVCEDDRRKVCLDDSLLTLGLEFIKKIFSWSDLFIFLCYPIPHIQRLNLSQLQ